MTQFAVAGGTQAETEEESGQHQAKGIDAVARDDRQHVHVDDFQREADDTADSNQQQSGESETAALLSVLMAKTGIQKFALENVLEMLAETIKEELVAGGAVTIPGIAKFAVKERPARTARNPATGGTVEVPAGRVAKVTLLKELKDTLAG